MRCAAQKRLLRTNRKHGRVNNYKPHTRMLKRISRELGWSLSQTYNQIVKERNYLLTNRADLPNL